MEGECRRILEADAKWIYPGLKLPEECGEPNVLTAQQKQADEWRNEQKPDVGRRIIPFLKNLLTANASPATYEGSGVEGLRFWASAEQLAISTWPWKD